MEIYNIDKVVIEDKKVKLKTIEGEEEYIIPGEISLYRVLEIMKNAEELEKKSNNPEVIIKNYESVWNCFKQIPEGKTFNSFLQTISIRQYLHMVTIITSSMGSEAIGDDLKKKLEELKEKTSMPEQSQTAI